MSEALYQLGGLRFWTEREIMIRNMATQTLLHELSNSLQTLNSAWTYHQMEGPILTPKLYIDPAYDEKDIFLTQEMGTYKMGLRPETTASSYMYAEWLMANGHTKPPLCVWQVGKSFRRELSDGATAAKLRFNEFYQIEFQHIYSLSTKADIRAAATGAAIRAIDFITRDAGSRLIPSDRLPSYSTETQDVEVNMNHQLSDSTPNWKEVASISTRTDFSVPGYNVLEVAVGLDRLVAIEGGHP